MELVVALELTAAYPDIVICDNSIVAPQVNLYTA